MRAHSTGQHSTNGRSAITIPPEWMPRCRGKSSTWVARSITSGGIGGPSSASPSNDELLRPHRSTHFASASAWPGDRPHTFAISRSADFGR